MKCIQFYDNTLKNKGHGGSVHRVSEETAQKLVSDNLAFYVAKRIWKVKTCDAALSN